jgi:hypothetical protein
MLFTVGNTKGKKVTVRDSQGRALHYVKVYDTDTREALIYVLAGVENGRAKFVISEGRILTTTVKIPDSTIEVDGQVY